MELLRVRFDDQTRGEKRKSAGAAIETGVIGSLKPWREVVMPHDDVASGRYQQAEFAADLWQVHLGEGTPEYKDPAEFFRRTFLTASHHRDEYIHPRPETSVHRRAKHRSTWTAARRLRSRFDV